MKRLVYLIGQPGAGKTSALRAVLAGRRHEVIAGPCPYTLHHQTDDDGIDADPVVELGKDRDTFGGTDALAMNVQPAATALLGQLSHELVVAEGDRLANDRFFLAAEMAGWELTVAWLVVPDAVAAARRAARGSNQSPTWVKGRQSKVRHLGQAWATEYIDATEPPEVVAARLRTIIGKQAP